MEHDDTTEEFEDRLWQFLLESFARGDRVAQTWYLVHTEELIPDVVVDIERVDGDGDSDPRQTGVERDFKTGLQDFLLDAFVNGDITGQWEVRYTREELPAWNVEITTESDETRHDDDMVEVEF